MQRNRFNNIFDLMHIYNQLESRLIQSACETNTGPAFKGSICCMRNGVFSSRGKETRTICSMTMTQRCERVYKRSEKFPRICFEATCQMMEDGRSLIRSRLRRTSLNDDFAISTKNGAMIKLKKYRLTADINDSKLLYNLFRDVYGPLSSPVNTFAQKNGNALI